MTLEEMKVRKRVLGLTAENISAMSGVPVSTIQKIFSGLTQSPRKKTMDAIAAVLATESQPGKEGSFTSQKEIPADGDGAAGLYTGDCLKGISCSGYNDLAGEAAPVYRVSQKKKFEEKKPGEYTIEDYYALPDERRAELIDGVIYDMAAPAVIHQKILGDLHILFRECMDRHEGQCEVYLSPCDVRLDRDNRTMVQPDLLVVCEEVDIRAKRIEGAPDLTVEILSPSTRSKDMLLKLYKYSNAGVREYWIVDPEQKTVLVYDLEHDNYYPEKYSFEDEIPILISGGGCSIDFSRILKRIDRYYQ